QPHVEGGDLDHVAEAEPRLREHRADPLERRDELRLGIGDGAAVRTGADLARAEKPLARAHRAGKVEAVVLRPLRGGNHEIGLLHRFSFAVLSGVSGSRVMPKVSGSFAQAAGESRPRNGTSRTNPPTTSRMPSVLSVRSACRYAV